MRQERKAWKANGFLFLPLSILVFLGALSNAIRMDDQTLISTIASISLLILILRGFVLLQPNEAVALTFFGRYIGSIKEDGFFWTNPFVLKNKISLKAHNFESEKIKVNDSEGNPIIIGAVIVWRVLDSAKALFDNLIKYALTRDFSHE